MAPTEEGKKARNANPAKATGRTRRKMRQDSSSAGSAGSRSTTDSGGNAGSSATSSGPAPPKDPMDGKEDESHAAGAVPKDEPVDDDGDGDEALSDEDEAPSVGEHGGDDLEALGGTAMRDDEDDSDGEGAVEERDGAPVLGEEERATIPSHRLVHQASAAGDFDYGAIGNRASDRFKTHARRIEADPWDTDAWTGLVKEAQNNCGGGMTYKDVLRERYSQWSG